MAKKITNPAGDDIGGPDFGATVEAQAHAPAHVNPFVRSLPTQEALSAAKETRGLSQIERDTKKPAIGAEIYGDILTIEFSHGKVIRLDSRNLTDDIRATAIMHGLKQKLVDAAAIPRDTNTGRSASLEDKYEAILEVANRIQGIGEDDNAPSWNKVRAGGPGSGGGASGGMLLRALVEFTGKPRVEVEDWLEGMSKEQKAGFKKDQSIAAIIARMQLEKAPATSVDTASLLAGFMSQKG